MMRTMAIAVSMLAGVAAAQVNPVELPTEAPAWATPISERNAALAYHRVWLVGSHAIDRIDTLAQELEDWQIQPGSTIEQELESQQDLIADLIEATTIATCDWQTRYEDGVAAAVPHTRFIRKSVRVLAADASRLVRDDDLDAAAVRIAAMYDLARHVSDDSVLISSTVGTAIGAIASERTAAMLDTKAPSSEGAATILAAIARLDPKDPYNTRRALLREGEMFVSSIVRDVEAEGPGAGSAFVAITEAVGGDPTAIMRMGDRGDEAIRHEAGLAMAFYRDAAAAWHMPDAQDRLTAIENALDRGEYGSMVSIIAPSVSSLHAMNTKSVDMVNSARSRLESAANQNQPGQAGRREAR